MEIDHVGMGGNGNVKSHSRSSLTSSNHTNGRANAAVLRPSVVCLSSVITYAVLWLNGASYRKTV